MQHAPRKIKSNDMLPDDVTARMLRQLKLKHPLQQDMAIEDALMEAIESPAARKNDILQEGLVFKIANNKLSNDWRRDRKHISLDKTSEQTSLKQLLADNKMDIETLLSGLREKDRMIVEMRMQDYSYEEIAEKLGSKRKNNLEVQYFRILEGIRKKNGKY